MLQRTVGLHILCTAVAHTKTLGLYINVVRPTGVSEGADLPVIVVSQLCMTLKNKTSPKYSGYTAVIPQNIMILCNEVLIETTGGFETGDASPDNGTHVVSRSLSLKSPVIYVSFNYRLNGRVFAWSAYRLND